MVGLYYADNFWGGSLLRRNAGTCFSIFLTGLLDSEFGLCGVCSTMAMYCRVKCVLSCFAVAQIVVVMGYSGFEIGL